MPAMIPVPKNREPREGEKWFYEFQSFMEQFPGIRKRLVYCGFQFVNLMGDDRTFIGGVFRIAEDVELPVSFLTAIENYSTTKIMEIRYLPEVDRYGKNVIVVVLR